MKYFEKLGIASPKRITDIANKMIGQKAGEILRSGQSQNKLDSFIDLVKLKTDRSINTMNHLGGRKIRGELK